MSRDPEIGQASRSKAQVRTSYDRLSRWYDLLASAGERKLVEAGLQMLTVQGGEVVLEIGCGTGHALLALARRVGNSGKTCGIDISQGMLSITRSRVGKAGHGVKLVCGDGADPPFAANSFDAIFMSFTLELFDTLDIPIVLCGCKRILRSGGRICVVAMSRKGKTSLISRLYEWAHQRFPQYVDCRPILALEALEEAGFRLADAKVMSTWGLPVEIIVARKP
jgi:ubiquinone/menaquinone biosynthesis C-methylase UbiE